VGSLGRDIGQDSPETVKDDCALPAFDVVHRGLGHRRAMGWSMGRRVRQSLQEMDRLSLPEDPRRRMPTARRASLSVE
jgi:hypothetical protein